MEVSRRFFWEREASDTDDLSIWIDDVRYDREKDGGVSCALSGWRCEDPAPRNLLSIDGVVFPVQRGPEMLADEWESQSGAVNAVHSICVPTSIEFPGGTGPFEMGGPSLNCRALLAIAFEPGSKLTQIGSLVFGICESLQSICIPSSVQILCSHCFFWFRALSSLFFEPASKLSQIEDDAFAGCPSLSSISFPASLESIGRLALTGANLTYISVDADNSHFKICEDFVVDFDGLSAIFSFRPEIDLGIANWIEQLGSGCFPERSIRPSVGFDDFGN
jgi:hypothetical protein